MSVIDKINIKGTNYDIHDRNALTIIDKGVPNGVAELDENGKLPSSQLPEDVNTIYEFENKEAFPIVGEAGNIYIAEDTNLMWRWDGNEYVTISSPVELGETSDTAYRGDRGKIAYDHANTSGNPHGTTKTDLGLGNVTDNKSLAVDELQNLTPTEKETARINIGAGTLADVRVNGVSVVDANDIAQIKSYKEITQAEYDALPDSKLSDNIMYCITDSENGGVVLNEITQAEYDALPSSLKNSSNTIYFITDGGGSGGSGITDVIVNGESVVEGGVATITTTDENVKRTSQDNKNHDRSVLLGSSSEGVGGVYTTSYLEFNPHNGNNPELMVHNKPDATYNKRTIVKSDLVSVLSANPSDSGSNNFGYIVMNSGANTAMAIRDNDIEIRTYQAGTTSVNQTWDGTHTSLKDALAAAKEGNILIVNIKNTNLDGNLFSITPKFKTTKFTSATQTTSTEPTIYADRTYTEVKNALNSGRVVILQNAGHIWVLTENVFNYITFKRTDDNIYISNGEIVMDEFFVTFYDPESV